MPIGKLIAVISLLRVHLIPRVKETIDLLCGKDKAYVDISDKLDSWAT